MAPVSPGWTQTSSAASAVFGSQTSPDEQLASAQDSPTLANAVQTPSNELLVGGGGLHHPPTHS
jgi:hypothetical protein